jgi:tRNA(Ile)-lysidine synthase
MEQRFLNFVREKELVQTGDRVLVAVSGGIDSMVLLHLFRATANELGITLVAAHFDHAMRRHSADDAEWLGGVCAAWGVELISARTDAALYGEANARTARYAFLQDAANQAEARRIATAHHADDQVETVLFRLMRGTGLRGLAGIPMRRGRLIRPLLRFRKAEIEGYAAANLIRFREDETNVTDAYARNRIRRAVIPAIQTVTQHAPEGILAVARHAARAEKAWNKITRDARRSVIAWRDADSVELARGILLEYDGEIAARLLRSEMRRLGVMPDARATNTMWRFAQRGKSGAAVTLSGGLRLERSYDVLRLTRAARVNENEIAVIDDCGSGSAVAQLGEKQWQVRWTTSQHEENGTMRFDCETLRFPLQIRGWRPGDRIRLHYGTKKLKKIFAEARIPVHERASVPVLADALGRVYWVAGIIRSIEAPPRDNHSAIAITIGHAEIS